MQSHFFCLNNRLVLLKLSIFVTELATLSITSCRTQKPVCVSVLLENKVLTLLCICYQWLIAWEIIQWLKTTLFIHIHLQPFDTKQL